MESVSGIVFDTGAIQLEGANHGVEAHGCTKQAFVGRIGEDWSRQAACVGAKEDGLKDGGCGLAKAYHIVVSLRANNGDVALPSCVEQGDDFIGGRHDGCVNQ